MERKVYLKRYRLDLDQVGLPEVIRRSATEATFRGEDLRTGRHVAVQVVPMQTLRSVELEQLETEAKTARELDHLNIPRLRAFGFEEDHVVYVTDYFAGTTAAEWVATKGPMPVGVVLRIALQVVDASRAATFHGLLHHAINPNNLVLVAGETSEGGWPLIKLINLLGVAADMTPAQNPESAEPFNFLSPEQVQTGAADFRSQMYSLGATLWFLLTGAAPIDLAAVENTTGLPAIVRHLLAQMLAIDPEARPLDPLALEAQIQDCLAQLDRRDAVASKLGLPLASEATAPKSETRRPNIWRPIAFAAMLIGLAALTALFLSRRSRSNVDIGVPVGISEKAAAAQASPAEPTVEIAPTNGQPPVLTSTADVSNEDQTTATSDSATNEAAEQPAEVMAQASPEISPDETAVATTSKSPAPAETPVVEQEQPAVAQAAPSPEISASPAAQEAQVILSNATPADRPTPDALQTRKPRVAKKTESESTPPTSTRAPERAQFLGMTPDGNLIYGSSSEKTLSAPAVRPEGAVRRKPSPRPTPETIDGLPVRPALPPDQ